MDLLNNVKKTFEDPYIVARIQKFFGVSYKGINTFKPTLTEAQISDETTAFQRKKSLQNSTDSYEAKENINETSPFEDETHIDNVNNESTDTKNLKNYTVKNKFWYFLFLFGTYFGDELGYAVSISFLFWNIDGVIGRKLVLVWTVIMYVGQSIKDIVKWPRPMCPPVIRLQKKWSLEYGMPSTHAMVGIAFPSSVFYYSLERYEFPVIYGIVMSAVWCIMISLSRLYLGMHSLLDVLVGLFLSSIMVIPLLPAIDYVDKEWLIKDVYWYPLALLVISFILLTFYPSECKWTPTKGDTSIILGTCVGIQSGCWLNIHLKNIQFSRTSSPLPIKAPDTLACGYIGLRMVVGLTCLVLSFIVFEVLFKVMDTILQKIGIAPRVVNERRHIPILDLSYKYLSYCVTAFHVTYSIPKLFQFLHIQNSSVYIE